MGVTRPACGAASDKAGEDPGSAAWLFEDSADLYLVVDHKGRVLHANRAWETLLGWTAAALQDLCLDDLTHPDDRHLALGAGALRRLRTTQGDWRWVSGFARDLGDGRQAAVLHDVTDQVMREKAVDEADRVRGVLSVAAGLSTLTLDPVTRALQFSAATGRSAGPIGSLDAMLAHLHPDDASDVERTLTGAMRHGGSGSYDVRVSDGHGEWLRFHVTYCTTPRPDGLHTVNGLSHDVTEQAKVRQEAQANAERLKLAMHAARAGVFETDLKHRAFWCSPEFVAIVGRELTFDEACGVWPVIHPDDAWKVTESIARSEAGSDSEADEWRILLPSGEYRWIDARASIRHDADGEVESLIGVVLDIDARKRQELALIEAERQAQAAGEAKSQFLANMSHEIRTPMNGVLGVLHLLGKEALSADGRKLLVEAEQCGKMLSQLLNDSIDFSRIEAGMLDLSNEPLDAVGLMQGVADMLRPQAVTKGLALNCRSDCAEAWIQCDPVRLRQALFNLMGNAVKFTTDGRVEARLSASPSGPGRVRLRFEIEDSGIGIAESAQASLFQRFTQADGAINRRFGGSGLGLAITRRLAELMGGGVGFTSQEGVGSVFWLEIDAETATAAADTPAVETGQSEGMLEGVSILLVEDNRTNRLVASKMLESLGASVDTAEDGVEGLKAVQLRPYDVVLMDVQMPNMDGIEATHRIRALKGEVSAVPIIALTANVMAHQVETYLAAGMNGAVAKPISPTALLAAIVKIFADAPATRDLAAG